MQPFVVNFCLCHGRVFSPFGSSAPRYPQNPKFWASEKANISKTVNRSVIVPRPYGRRQQALLLSVRPSVCMSVAYIANNSTRTQRPSVPKFGRKVPHLRCDSHTSFKIKRSKVRVRGGRGHTVSAGHTACLFVVAAVRCNNWSRRCIADLADRDTRPARRDHQRRDGGR